MKGFKGLIMGADRFVSRDLLPGMFIFCLTCSVGWFCTSRFGVGLNPDSAAYLSQAESLRAGKKPFDYKNELTSHYPPGYPLLVAGASVVSFRDVRHGAPRLVALLSMAGVGLVTWLLLRVRGLSPLAAGSCVAGGVLHPAFVSNGVMAQTEMPWLLSFCLSLYGLELWSRRRLWGWLLFAALLAGVGAVIRYAGVVWPIAAACVVFICNDRGLRQRLLMSCGFLAICFLPLMCWLLYARLVFPLGNPRSFTFHPLTSNVLMQGLRELSAAVAVQGSLIGLLVYGVLFSVLVIHSVRSKERGLSGAISDGEVQGSAGTAVGIFLTGYVTFLCISISCFDRATPLDARILLPATWALIFLVCEILWVTTLQRLRLQAACFWLLLLWFGMRGVYETVPVIAGIERDGIGLSTAGVLYDRSLSWVREECPKKVKLYSNVSWIPWLVCKRPVLQLPSRVDYTSGRPVLDYQLLLDRAVEDVRRGEAIFVIDTEYDDPNYLTPTLKDLVASGLIPASGVVTGRFVVLARGSE